MTEANPNPNLRWYVSLGRLLLEVIVAAVSGVLLALAFPPLEWGMLAWVAMVPLLLLPVSRTLGRRAALGYVFGAAYFVVNLWWLNTIGFGAGLWLGLYCGLFLMAWYLLAGWAVKHLAPPPTETPRLLWAWALSPVRQCVLVVFLSAAWVAIEWLRSWLFTGFSWNQLGVSQWARPNLLALTTVTGVYGVSFVLVAINVALALSWPHMWQRWRRGGGGISWPLAVAVLFILPVMWLGAHRPRTGPPDRNLRVLAVQGCIPQCREWTQQQLDDSLAAYTSQSRDAVRAGLKPDLILWPETAIPAPLRFDTQYGEEFHRLVQDVQTSLLIGTIDYRPVGPVAAGAAVDLSAAPEFNSAMLFAPDGQPLQVYDKIHRVPFGEYTPFGRYLPWLVDWIGMGRGLTAGREFTVFRLPNEVRAGVMICYEDAFPDLARQFVVRGAGLLITLTNDAWYAESAGSRQHLLHAVLRAAENCRPLMRAGNNSDTCLIWPDGRITGLLTDPMTGSRFVRASQVYEVPVWDELPMTWYSLHGDVFARGCAGLTLAGMVWGGYGWLVRKRALLRKVQPD